VKFTWLAPLWAVILSPLGALAGDVFEITAHTTSGPPLSKTASGSSIISLTEDLVEARGDFKAFDGRALSGSLTYAGMKDAVRFAANADGTNVTLTIPSTGFSRTFTGASRSDVERQIRDFLKREGAQAWGTFLGKVNEKSMLAVNDGNPQSLTATLAAQAFGRFAQRPNMWHQPDAMSGDGELRIDASAGPLNTDDGDGYAVNVALTTSYDLSDRVGLSLSLPLLYRTFSGAQVYGIGLEVGLPLRLVAQGPNDLSWQMTPFFTGGASFSEDFAAGGVVLGGGVSSLLSIPLGGDLTVVVGNQVSYHGGLPLDVSNVRFDPDVMQYIARNGAQVIFGRDWRIEGSLIWTHFFREAALEDYFTPSIGVSKALGQLSGLRVAWSADLGVGYVSHNLSVLLYLGW
jgi:hypothetical protein